MILVSSCLAGMKVRYNGTDCLDERLGGLLANGRAVTVCPELLGGFSTPREPAEIVGGSGGDVLSGHAQVIDKSGRDVTELYVLGARETLQLARRHKASVVVLKENSPSCGSSHIYNGEFAGIRTPGQGVTAALLARYGIRVISEHELHALLAELDAAN